MKKYKGLLAALILILPSAIYIFFSYGNHNFAHLPYVGGEDESQHQHIPEFSFTNQFGEAVSQEDYQGNIYLANFVFTTCPTICPVMTYNMRRIQQKMESYPFHTLYFLNMTLLKYCLNMLIRWKPIYPIGIL